MARDAYTWPFPWNSIWNMPIGDSADLVDANISAPTGKTLNVENDILIQMPDNATRDIDEHDGAWSTTDRCNDIWLTGAVHEADMPIPAVGVWDTTNYHGSKPNHSTSILVNGASGVESWETQPFHICSDYDAISQYHNSTWGEGAGNNIMTGGLGDSPHGGSHGGAKMSALGGTIRSGEWVSGGEIPHAIKIQFDSSIYLYGDGPVGHRWPANAADSGWDTNYGSALGANPPPEMLMGALLTLPQTFNISTELDSECAQILATAIQTYGAYIVDGAGWDTIQISIEWSPDHMVEEEFETEWGFPMDGSTWSSSGDRLVFLTDMVTIYENLHVVDDNSSSNVGGAGTRVGPYAPDFTPEVAVGTAYFPQAVATSDTASLELETYRWRNDDGGETDATWAAAQDTAIYVTDADRDIRLRCGIANHGVVLGATADYNIQYRENGGTWTTIGSGTPVSMGETTTFDTGDPTTQQLTTGGFSAGEMREHVDASGIFNLALAANAKTELEWNFDVNAASVVSGDMFEFVVRYRPDDGTAYAQLDTLTVLPTLYIIDPAEPVALTATATFPAAVASVSAVDATPAPAALAVTSTFPTAGTNTGATWNGVTVLVEAAFGYDPYEQPVWTDISTYVRRGDITRGILTTPTPTPAAGVCTLTLDNRDGRFDPDNTSSPYSPNVKTTVPIRVRAGYSGVTYPQFYGFASSWDLTYPHVGSDAVATVVAMDAIQLFTLASLSDYTYPEEKTDVRIGAILDDVGWFGSMRTIDDGLAEAAAVSGVDSTAFQQLLGVVNAEIGRLFVDAAGKVVFHSRTHNAGGASSAATFGETALPYQNVVRRYDDMHLYNEFRATRPAKTTEVHIASDAVTGRIYVTQGTSTDNGVSFKANTFAGGTAAQVKTAFESLPGITSVSVSGSGQTHMRFEDGSEREHDPWRIKFLDPTSVPADLVIDNQASAYWDGTNWYTATVNVTYLSDAPATQVSTDDTSINEHGRRVYQIDGPFIDDATALNAADWGVELFKASQPRIARFDVTPLKDPTSLWPVVLDLDLRDIVTVQHQPLGGGTAVDEDVALDSIHHTFSPDMWRTTYTCYPLTAFEQQDFWILGTSDDLGTDTVLA